MALRAGTTKDEGADPEVIELDALSRRRRPEAHLGGIILVVFMRVIAVIWLALGLWQWVRILLPVDGPLDALPLDVSAAIVFFAVGNLVVAVGLWLAGPWGGVLWLVMVATEIVAMLVMPAYFPGGSSMTAVYLALVFCYFVATWYASQERDRY